MLAVRRMVHEEIPSASETVNDLSYAVTVGFTFSGRFKEAFCYVMPFGGSSAWPRIGLSLLAVLWR